MDLSSLHSLKNDSNNLGHYLSFDSLVNNKTSFAFLPEKPIMDYLWKVYIEKIHIFFPIVNLRITREMITNIYDHPSESSNKEKSIIFMILAISSEISSNDKTYLKFLDLNTSDQYFSSAFKFLEDFLPTVHQDSIIILLLLTVWCLILKNDRYNNDNIWLLTRHIISICIQLGYHRNNPSWNLEEIDIEIRNRLWWCAFIFERRIAVQTGRTLSIRNLAINAELPKFHNDIDHLDSSEKFFCKTYNEVNFQPMYLLAKLETIGGDILESVYVASGKKTLVVEIVQKSAISLREELDLWLETVMDLYKSKYETVFQVLKLQGDLYSMMLSRPSPFFPVGSLLSAEICLKESKSYIDILSVQMKEDKILQMWPLPHNLLTTAMTFLYSVGY